MNSAKDLEEHEEVQEGQDVEEEGEEEEEEEKEGGYIISVNSGSPGKNKENICDVSPNGH